MTAPTEREVLEALWDRVDMRGYAIRARFTAMLDAEAYESAALMLVPEGWGGSVRFSENRAHNTVELGRSYPINAIVYGEGATPALALCAAIEAAIAREGE